MTDPSEVTISDAEVRAIAEAVWTYVNHPKQAVSIRRALAAFLAARVPDAKDWKAWMQFDPSAEMKQPRQGFNACRDAVLKGGV